MEYEEIPLHLCKNKQRMKPIRAVWQAGNYKVVFWKVSTLRRNKDQRWLMTGLNQDEPDFLESVKRASILSNRWPRISALRVFLISPTWKITGEVTSPPSFREPALPGFASLCPWCSAPPQAQGWDIRAAHRILLRRAYPDIRLQRIQRSFRSWIHISSSLSDRSVLAHV